MNQSKIWSLWAGIIATLFSAFIPHGRAQLIPPDPYYQLDSWSFDDPNFLSDLGDSPISMENLGCVPSFDGNAVQVDSTNAAWLQYSITNSAITNLTFPEGAIELWISPDWNSGGGPGNFGRIIDVGAYSTNTYSSWWSLYFTPDGSSINFSSETNGVFTNYLSVPIGWSSNTWHFLALTYNHFRSELYVDGQLASNGGGVFYVPSSTILSNGFFVGSDATGTAQSRACIDDMATYSYAISAYTVSNDYASGLQLMGSQFTGGGLHTDGTGLLPSGFSGGGDTNASPDGLTYTPPDFGTNLWIADPNISSNFFGGTASNTVADVEYEIQTIGDLTQTNWVSQGFFLGSETTNYTPLNNLPVNLSTNCFVRLRSWADDGSGIPIWWELQYFGTNGVDPDAQDAAGDGWTIYQKYQMGLNPNVFYTPPTPQFAVSFNATNNIATVSWLPAPGPVTNYVFTVEDETGNSVHNVSPTNFSFQDDLTAEVEDAVADYGTPNIYFADYSVEAQYAGGNSSGTWDGVEYIPPPNASLVNGPQGKLFLNIQGLPADLSKLEIFRQQNNWDVGAVSGDYQQDYSSVFNLNSSINDGYFEIPAAEITNGVCQLPESQVQPYYSYTIYVQTIRSNGVASTWAIPNPSPGTQLASTPFVDARRQLKDNLQFLLRDAPVDFLLGGAENLEFSWPGNYVYAGFYSSGAPSEYFNSLYYPYYGYNFQFSGLRPIQDNFFYRNFVYDSGNLSVDGWLQTGLIGQSAYGSSYGPDGYSGGAIWSYSYGQVIITNYPEYSFDLGGFLTNSDPLVPASQLSLSSSQWLLPWDAAPRDFGNSQYTGSPIPTDMVNAYGLPLVSEEFAYETNDVLEFATCYPGDITPTSGTGVIYSDMTAPSLVTSNYYFARVNMDFMPEMSGFATTNTTPLFIQPVGTSLQIAGYAQLSLQNGYTNVYAYLGQYFDQAYVLDSNGNATTNSAGILSPAGNFFATEPGPVGLETMPDIDTGERGTCTVYTVSLALDKNHDGVIDTSFNGADATTVASPYVFWCNNNFDRWDYDTDDQTNYMDDVLVKGCPLTPRLATPDFEYRNTDGERMIPTTRDLEDFARLWVCGVTTNLLARLPSGSTLTLSWGDVGSPNAANPTIDIFTAADADGGMGYLTNSTLAAEQLNHEFAGYVGRLAPGESLGLTSSNLLGGWVGTQFIWCGVTNGSGALTLTIADGRGNVLATTVAYIKIVDIKQMYERWTVGEYLSDPPATNAIIATDPLPVDMPGFKYTAPPNTNTPYILLVHGWNMEPWEKDRFAETAFKRLYWQGYQGRFGMFHWPTGNGFDGISTIATNLAEKDNFDDSEHNAWLSGQGLLNKLADLNSEYPGHVYLLAHSMGNVVAGEALRLAGTNQVVNTYAASQGAVSAHAYDENTNDVPDYSFYYPPWSLVAHSPNVYGNWFAANDGGGANRIVNLYNTNDFALSRALWQLNQLFKPDQDVSEDGFYWNYGYDGFASDPPPWTGFYKKPINAVDKLYFDLSTLPDRYEVMAYDAESWTTPFGATPNVGNIAAELNLNTVWPNPDPLGRNYASHYFHSAEFRGDATWEWNYWHNLLFSPVTGFNISNP